MLDAYRSNYRVPKSVVVSIIAITPASLFQIIFLSLLISDNEEKLFLSIFGISFIYCTIILYYIYYVSELLQHGEEIAIDKRMPILENMALKFESEKKILRQRTINSDKISLNTVRAAYLMLLLSALGPPAVFLPKIFYLIIIGRDLSNLDVVEIFSSLLAVIIFGLLIFWLRELRQWFGYGYMEALFGIGFSSVCFKSGYESPSIRLLALVGGIRVFVDGLKRIREFHPKHMKKHQSLSEYFYADKQFYVNFWEKGVKAKLIIGRNKSVRDISWKDCVHFLILPFIYFSMGLSLAKRVFLKKHKRPKIVMPISKIAKNKHQVSNINIRLTWRKPVVKMAGTYLESSKTDNINIRNRPKIEINNGNL